MPEFLRADGRRLVRRGEEVRLRGLMFGFDRSPPSAADYDELARIGLNVITLPFSYRPFVGEEASAEAREGFWAWIDAHVRLAREHDLLLILQLAGIEGAQFVPDREWPYDYRIWEDAQMQENMAAVWRAVAGRLRDEPTVAGYSLFQEPVCGGPAEQWPPLAARLAAAVRDVDSDHVLFVDRSYGEHETRREISGVELEPERAFPLLDDPNVVYEFYFFERDEYTHQFAPWRPEPELRRERRYPDPGETIRYEEHGREPVAFAFDRDYLEHQLARQLELRRRHDVPMFVWGFGLGRACLEHGRGGMTWLEDVIGLFEESELNWVLLAYRDEFFGIADDEEVKALLKRLVSGS